MKNLKNKLKSKKGETLVGILVAILIVALSAGMFATMDSASMNINLSAQKQDEAFYDAVGELEQMEKSDNAVTSDGQLKYSSDSHSESVDVEYSTQDGLSVYRDKDSGTDPDSEENNG